MRNACLKCLRMVIQKLITWGKIGKLSANGKMSNEGLKNDCYKNMAHLCFLVRRIHHQCFAKSMPNSFVEMSLKQKMSNYGLNAN